MLYNELKDAFDAKRTFTTEETLGLTKRATWFCTDAYDYIYLVLKAGSNGFAVALLATEVNGFYEVYSVKIVSDFEDDRDMQRAKAEAIGAAVAQSLTDCCGLHDDPRVVYGFTQRMMNWVL